MRNWLKGMFGSTVPLPPGITPTWAEQLRTMLADAHIIDGTALTGSDLDSAVEFILLGVGQSWVHPSPTPTGRTWISYRSAPRAEQPAFYASLADVPGEVLLRWALVLEGFTSANRGSKFHIPFPGKVHWPEVVLAYGAGAKFNTWPPSTTQCIAYATLERILTAAGMEPFALLSGAFATPVDAGYGASLTLVAVSYCPDFSEAMGRHLAAIRPLILPGSATQRLHALAMLARVTPEIRDRLAPELAELAVSSSKQVRIAADAFVGSAGPSIVGELKRLACGSKPDQRVQALRLLHQRGLRLKEPELVEFARSTAAADKAPSAQALITEWEAGAIADAAPEARYEVAPPVIAWHEQPDARVSPLLRKMWQDMNVLIRQDNHKAHEHYERWRKEHGTPKWKLRQTAELPSEWLASLDNLLASGMPPGPDNPSPTPWVALSGLRTLASDASLKPTVLFKVLHHAGHLYQAIRGGGPNRLNHVARDCFNRLYAATGRPTLLELATMISNAGRQADMVFYNYCSGHNSLGRTWRKEDVWPYMAQQVPAIERLLLGLEKTDYYFERLRLYEAIATLPSPPPRIVNALYAVAVGQGRSERRHAQDALAALPDKEARIVSALSDGKSEVRTLAAQWLGRLKHDPAIPALEKALSIEKHDNAKGALLDALEALGQPVDKYLKRDLLLAEARKSLAKGMPKDLTWVVWDALPAVRWSDSGEGVAPEVLQWMMGQACRANSPEPNAVLRKYCAMFEPQERERFGQWVLDQWLTEDVAPIAQDDAEQRAQASAQGLHQGMTSHPKYYQNHPLLGKSLPEIVAYHLPGFLRQPKGSAIASKGVLAVAAACAGGGAAAPVARYIKEWYGTRASQGKALIAMLAWIDHPNATQVMLAIGNRFRTKSIQEEASRQAESLAERKGWTLAELADRTIPSAGFDERGELDLPFGPRSFQARLLPTFKIELFNPDGKKIASLPEPRVDDDAELAKAAKKSLSAAKKDIKSIIDLQTDRLYEALCTGRDWSFSDWDAFLNRHPIVRQLVQRLVWIQQPASGAPAAFRPLADGTLTNEADEAVEIQGDARIRLAHDMLLPPEAVYRWQQHLIDYEVTPLFQQLGKGKWELPSSQVNAKEVTDFKGHLLEAFALRGRATKLGYQRGSAEDGGWFHVYEKRFATLGVAAVLEFTGNSLPEENRTVSLIRLTFSPTNVENSWERSEIPLGKVPKVLLSECYNDARLMAGEGTGFDPDWEKKSAY
jgi:Domain of unknown function (DUF4132)